MVFMIDKKVFEMLNEVSKKLPKLSDGRIDYSNSDVAPVVTVFVRYNNEILLLKRSNKVRTYKGKWNTVAGYIDEFKPLKEKILEELREEIGVDENDIASIKFGEPYEFFDEKIKKKWIVFPALVELRRKIDVNLDWEHVEFKWIKKDEIRKFDTVPNLIESLKRALKEEI